jgi:hypothetical protein
MIGFARTGSMAVLGAKLGTDPRTDQPACCGLWREPFFSGAVAPLNFVETTQKVSMRW